MQIKSLQSYKGKNIYSHRPVIKMVVDLEELVLQPTKDYEGFNDRLLEYFPGLRKHYCSLGYEGGFADRLKEGTYIGHVTEHLILELQSLMGYEVNYGKTRVIQEPCLYMIVFEYANERCGMECGRAAVRIASSLARRKAVDIPATLTELERISVASELGPSTRSIVEEAKARGIPVQRIGNEGLVQLGYGKYSRWIEASLSDGPSCITVDTASNKQLTKQILQDYKIPVPHGDIAYTEESSVMLAETMGYPVVLKPFDANQGKGVSLELKDEAQVRHAYREASRYSKGVIVEQYVSGRDYRILVIGDRVSAVCERKPPMITGDGVHTVRELVEFENNNPLRGDDHEKPLTKIKLDTPALQVMERAGLDEVSVPEKGCVIRVRDNGNLSTGGTARECISEIHPCNAALAVRAARAIGLDIAGVDVTTEDISKPLNETGGAVIEVNAAPGLRMHLYPTEGEPVNVAADIIDLMFPADQPHSVPIVSITGTNGKTTTTRLVKHTLAVSGKKIGMTSTSGVFIGEECILKGDNTGPVSARLVLQNRETEMAVLETARGGIVRKGLGYDAADVGAILNISDDHLGLEGLNTLEDLAFVKSLVIEAVKPNGYAVLNADDGMLDYFLKRVASKVILFSTDEKNQRVAEHVEKGEKAVWLEGDTICVYSGKKKTQLMTLSEIPITFGGQVECNIENALAAVAILHALHTSFDQIRMGLKSFNPDVQSNPGRFNLFPMGDFRIMLDYGHNPAGYSAVLKFLQKMEAKRLVGVIGVPGDRLDRNIAEVGQICGRAFSKVYIKEDTDLRGRAPGEVADILYQSIVQNGMRKEDVAVIPSELKALETAMLDAQPGDLIVMMYEEFEPAVELIQKFKEEMEANETQVDMAVEEPAG